jgi:transcriptional regulator with XRE-family HTH domain
MDVGEKLLRLRNSLAWTQKKMAEEGHCSLAYIRTVEVGKTSPTVRQLDLILRGAGSSLAQFFESKVPLEITDPEMRELCEKLAQIFEAGGAYSGSLKMYVDAMHEKVTREIRKTKKPLTPKAERRTA